ncbi:hypothetical protein [Methylobacterium nigriterrae]|uniref:hypothetical protein n=1 Tax=Methylobacterium nigriterrae TaxID=3127512 RepID=UPI0030133C3C
MSKALITAACLLLLPLPALAQSSSRDDDRGGSYDRGDSRKDDMRYHPNEDRERGYRHGYADDAPRGGSSFHMKIGDAKINVRCGPRETLKDCVDAATTLLDKARSLPVSGSANTGSGNAPSKP